MFSVGLSRLTTVVNRASSNLFIRSNASRARLRCFLEQVAARVTPEQRVLDAGAGDAPYTALFQHAKLYHATDLRLTPGAFRLPDYVCNLRAIPCR